MTEPSQQESSRPAGITLRFVLLFCVLLFVFSMGVLLPPSLIYAAISATGALVVFFAGILGISASFEGVILTVSGFRMEVILECTAVQYIGMYAAGVLAYPYKSLRSKAMALLVGAALILLINAARLIVIGKIGAVAPDLFEFVHVYLWQSTFGIMVFLLWLGWVQSFQFQRLSPKKAALFVVYSAAVLVIVRALFAQIIGMFAWLAQAAFNIMPMLRDFTVAVRHNLIVVMRFRGDVFDIAVYDISVDLFASSLIVPLLAVSSKTIRVFFGRLWRAGLVLLLMHLLSVAIAGYLLHFSAAGDVSGYLYWLLHIIAVMAPLLIFLHYYRKDRPLQAGQPS